MGTAKIYQFPNVFENNICIGDYAGHCFFRGRHNIFLGTGAGAELTESNNKLIVRSASMTLEKDITKEEWEAFRDMIYGAVLKPTEAFVPPVAEVINLKV